MNKERAIIKRKCFVCGCLGHIAYHYKNKREIEENRKTEVGGPECWPSNNQFKVLTNEVIQAKIQDKRKEKKKKLLREVIVKIGLKQEDNKDGITMEALLDSRATGLVMSSEFVRKNKFKKKLNRPIYEECEQNLQS